MTSETDFAGRDGHAAPLGALKMIAYAFGALGSATILSTVTTQLLIYWTDIAGIAPAVAGSLLFIAETFDALTDIGVGVMSDRWQTRWGRRRPWILAGAILLCISSAALFCVDVLPARTVFLASTVTVFLFFIGLSMAQVPHLALAAEITRGYEERTALSAFVYGSNIIAGALGVALPPALIAAFGGRAAGFHGMALVVAPIPMIAGIVCFWGIASAKTYSDVNRKSMAPPGKGKWLFSLRSNGPLIALCGAKVCTYLGASAVYAGMAYYSLYVAHLGPTGMIVFGSAVAAGNLAGLALVLRFFLHADKHLLYGSGMLGLGLVTLLFAVAASQQTVLVFGAHVFIFGVLAAAVAVPGQSMMPDVVEWDQLKFGPGREGALFALISAIQKTTPAVAVLILGMLLSWGGYLANASVGKPDENTSRAIVIAVAILPGIVMCLGAIPMLFFYDLTEQKLAAARAT